MCVHHGRRAFLKGLGLATAGSMLFSPLGSMSYANTNPYPRNYIFCYFNGGWDQLLALDPRDPKVFTKANVAKYKTDLGYDLLKGKRFNDGTPIETSGLIRPSGSNISFGPAMAPFAKHFDVSCVLRGVMMDTVAHDIGRRYFITGEMPAGLTAKGSSWGTRIVAQEGEGGRDIPNLVLRVETYNREKPEFSFATALQATSTRDLLDVMSRNKSNLSNDLLDLLRAYQLDRTTICDPTSLDDDGLMSLVSTAQKRAYTLLDKNHGGKFDFLNPAAAPDVKKLATRYDIKTGTESGAQAALALQAIRHGISQCVTIELAKGLDTHVSNWADDQPTILYDGFKALSLLVEDLKNENHPDPVEAKKGKSLLDNTTIVCFSEFARTPLVNSKQGRDHFLASSCLLIGAGVPHNKVVGKTDDVGMNPWRIDPNTGNPTTSSKGIFLNPQNILSSLMDEAGYSTDALREGPMYWLSPKPGNKV